MPKKIVIAGAGISGLAAAAAFKFFGHDVTVYEQSHDPREIGAGIYMKENGFYVLDRLRLTEGLCAKGQRMGGARIIDEDGETVVDRKIDQERLYVILRGDLHSALRVKAEELGAEIVTNTKVAGASPDGRLHLSDGTEVKADLVIGADGINSRVRDSLDLLRAKIGLGDGATRVIVPRGNDEAYSTEYWSGKHRVGVAPTSPDWTYMFIIGPERFERATRLPLDVAYWSRLFPHLEDHFASVTMENAIHHRHQLVHLDRWSRGNVAIIGDAAHGQPPNLGQGAAVAMAAAWELAESVDLADTVRDAVEQWEATVRPKISMVQKLTTAYDVLHYKWPASLAPARSALFQFARNNKVLSSRWEHYWRGGVVAPKPSLRSQKD